MRNWFLLDKAFEKLKHALLEKHRKWQMIERGKLTGFFWIFLLIRSNMLHNENKSKCIQNFNDNI